MLVTGKIQLYQSQKTWFSHITYVVILLKNLVSLTYRHNVIDNFRFLVLTLWSKGYFKNSFV